MLTRGPVLVTGAGGFVCSEIAVSLARSGHEVFAVDQSFDLPTRARLTGMSLIEGKLPEILAKISLRPETVIHGAAVTVDPEHLGLSRAAHMRRNIEMLTGALDFAQDRGVGRFLFLSSMGVFRTADMPAPGGRFTETTLPGGSCPYAIAKRSGEVLTQASAEEGFATLSLRLGNVFGPYEAVRDTRQRLCLVARMITDARAGRAITVATPDARREWIWLPDLADFIARIALGFDFQTPNVLHAGAPPVTSDLDLARAIAERMPGATICRAPPPHTTIRPPMGSDHADILPEMSFTDLPEALDKLIEAWTVT